MEYLTSRQNPLLAQIRRLNASRTDRRALGLFVAEGPKLLAEAVQWGAEVTALVRARGAALPCPEGAREVEVPADLLKSLSDTVTPQDGIFLCRTPALTPPPVLAPGRYLVLDGVQDPGNVGTIWRTADALGGAGIFLINHCADPFSPKTVRASMGACFRLPVWETTLEGLLGLLEAVGIPLYAAALRADTLDVREAGLAPSAVVIGSEGRGVSQEILDLCAGTLKIPMRARCESLNAAVAAAVVLWEGARGEELWQV